jgi:Carboxypeptidase regulatory-like domain/TonB dependent receptor/TonB-dependent Receptor Plug Domain
MRMNGQRCLCVWIALVLIACRAQSLGQGIVTGSISGTVEDPSAAVIVNASVTATEDGTNATFKTASNSSGGFQIPGMPIGAYTVTIQAPGFISVNVHGVIVTSSGQTSLGVQTLKIGNSEAVTVEGATALLQPDSVQISQSFDTQKVANLPIGNGFDIVALLTPGVSPSGGNNFTNNNGAEFSTNGLRDRNNNFELDGQANNDTNIGGPNVFFGNQDALEEVQIITNDSAEYGKNSGAVVNYITKAGTNAFHGTGYEFYNGSWADSLANQDKSPLLGYCVGGEDPSSGCIAPSVPRYVDNRWGGTLGGPILRDKLWFFGSGNFEHTRTGTAPSSSAPFLTPTPNGISQLQAAFPNNPAVGALAAIGPTSIPVGNLTFSAPTTVNVLGQPIEFGVGRRTIASPFNDYEGTGRVDYQLGQHDRLFGRYIYQNSESFGLNYFSPNEAVTGGFVNVPGTSNYVGIDWSHTFSDHFLNQARYSYSQSSSSFEAGGFASCTSAAILTACPIRGDFTDGQTLSLGEQPLWPQGRIVRSHQVQDNASWQAGKHFLKLGGEFNHYPETDTGLPNVNGDLIFANFSSYISSSPSLTLYVDGPASIDLTYNYGALYLQDDWKASENLTLSLGLRYELQSQPLNGLHNMTVQRESNAATAFWDQSLPIGLRTVQSVPLDKHNFGPVVGFSWMPKLHRQGNTVVRGGFRIGFDPTFNNPFVNIAGSTPVVNSATLQTCQDCIPANGQGSALRSVINPQVPRGINPGERSQENVDPKLFNPYTEQWTIGLQQSINSHMVGELRYLGNHAVGLFQIRNGNPALGPLIAAGFSNVIPAGLTPCTTPNTPGFDQGYVDCNHTNVLTLGNTGYSNYNGLQSRLSIEHWHGITAGVSYTFSKDMDNTTEIYSTLNGGNTSAFAQSPFDLSQAERAVSGLDYPNLASIYMIFEVPAFKQQNTLAGKLLGGWQVNPVWRYARGQPYTAIESFHSDYTDFATPFDTSLCDPEQDSGATTCRPILANARAPIDSVGLCLNSAAGDCGLVDYYTSAQFTSDPTATPVPVSKQDVHWIVNDLTAAKYYGTPFAGAKRNLQRGDSINTVNLAVLKDIKIGERFTFEARASAYNLMNRQYRGTPGVNVDFGSFADVGGSFANTYFNANANGETNSVFSGIDRRRLEVGGKIIF